jgi:hypothetical protein
MTTPNLYASGTVSDVNAVFKVKSPELMALLPFAAGWIESSAQLLLDPHSIRFIAIEHRAEQRRVVSSPMGRSIMVFHPLSHAMRLANVEDSVLRLRRMFAQDCVHAGAGVQGVCLLVRSIEGV